MSQPAATNGASRATRAEKQAETRERLLATAKKLFLDLGYAGTSLDRVADEAGYSKGAVYSNFDGKEELCLAVLDEIHDSLVRSIAKIFSGEGDLETQLDVFVAWAQNELADPRWAALELEFTAVGGQNPWVAQQLVNRHREMTELIRLLVIEISRKSGLRGIEQADRTASALLAVGIGLGALRFLDDQIDMTVFGDVVRSMVRASSPKPGTAN